MRKEMTVVTIKKEEYIRQLIEWLIEEYTFGDLNKAKRILRVIEKDYKINVSFVEIQTKELLGLCDKYGVSRHEIQRKFSSALWLCSRGVMKEKINFLL